MGNRLVMAEMILKPRFWQGNKLKFDSLVSSMQLERGKIYFVGDSINQRASGLDNSKNGIINIATSSTTFVQFGTFDNDEIIERITEIEQRLEELGGNIDELINEVVTLDEEVVILGGKVSEIGSKVSTIEEGAEKNKINVVERNGQAITPSEDKVVNILVPVNTSELNNDSKYQTDSDVAETIIGVKLNVASGIITLTRKNGTTFTIDLPTEKIIKSGYYDSKSEEIVLVLADDSEIRFNASQLIDEYYADNVTLEQYTDTADGNKKKFRLTTSYKNKIDGAEQTSNKTASVTSSSTATQYPAAKAVWEAIKDFATNVQTFTQATTRANIESGETISTIFGKIRKWFADLKTVAFSGSYNDLSDKPTIGNGTITIKQKGVEKGIFSMNQTGNATIELTDDNTTYSAAGTSLGLVKTGGDVTILDGTISVNDNSHNHSASNITSGTLAVARGGTGQTSTVNASNAFINALTEGTSTPVDNDYMITQYANGGTTTTTYHRRKMSVVWEYFKSKISSVLGLTSSNYGGTAAKATKDGSGNTITSTYATKSQLTDGSVTKVGTATKGSTTKPIYLNAGVPTECDDYAGGTAVTLNGSSKSGSTTSFYAPTKNNINGTNNWVLISSGPNFAPQFKDILQFGISNGVTFNKFHRGISFFNKKMYQSGSAECDWTYSSAVVFSGATITFTKGLSTAIESGVMTLWVEKGAMIKMDEWTSSWGTYVTNTYLAQRSGLVSVGCWGDPKVYTLSSLDLFVRGTLELTDSNLSTYYDASTEILSGIPKEVGTIVFKTTNQYKISAVQVTDVFNGKRITLVGNYIPSESYAHTTTSGRFSQYLYEHRYGSHGGGDSNAPVEFYEDFIYFNGIWFGKGY